MSSTGSFEEKERESRGFLASLDPGQENPMLVAFSGGPDSTALLYLLLSEYSESRQRIGVAYYNHNLRGKRQAALESSHAESLAGRLHVRFHHGGAKPGEILTYADVAGISIEEAARVYRYRFLRSTADTYGYRYIATGHTRDDLVETLIQRFFQGSGVWGLCGIPRIAGDIIRPILTWSRSDVSALNAYNQVRPFHDPSNRKTMYLRNAIRHSLIPGLKQVFPDFEKSLENLVVKMSLAREYMEDSIASRVQWEQEDGVFSLPAEYFMALHGIERIESVRSLINRLCTKEGRTARIPFQSLSGLIHPVDVRDNAILYRGFGYRLQVHAGKVVFEPDVVFAKGKGYFKVVQACEHAGWSSMLQTVSLRIKLEAGSAVDSIPAAEIAFPLLIRSRRDGDTIRLKGISKELKKLYNEWCVPEQDRWKIPVCEDRRGIIAVVGKPFGYKTLKRVSIAPQKKNLSYTFER